MFTNFLGVRSVMTLQLEFIIHRTGPLRNLNAMWHWFQVTCRSYHHKGRPSWRSLGCCRLATNCWLPNAYMCVAPIRRSDVENTKLRPSTSTGTATGREWLEGSSARGDKCVTNTQNYQWAVRLQHDLSPVAAPCLFRGTVTLGTAAWQVKGTLKWWSSCVLFSGHGTEAKWKLLLLRRLARNNA